ncbi:RecB-like helicase [Sulfurovum sp. bin170]|uniref:RecB-like helicase n=1 Tax=Sulfurovum sp. bin170 TaxID=2695268 RepID=UPI0013DEF17D|nr:RecB-like helicase [Sulfurovum sp. bin170]NEW59806.1 RecB-like helicase [Sulfurovum sp. bin170]
MSNNYFKPYLAYSASAGSGKTFALSVRYISLLFLDQEPSTILAATFTNKAAAEMKQRVLSLLINLADKKAELSGISEQTGLSMDELLAKQPEVLENFLSSTNFIVTLDSFFTSILRSASLYIDIEPDFVTKEIDDKAKEKIFLEEIQAHSLLSDLVKLAMNIEDKRFLKMFELMQNFYKIDPLLPDREYELTNITGLETKIDMKRERLHKLVVESGASKTAIKNFEPIEVKGLFKKTVFEKESLLDHRNYKKYVEKNPAIEDEFLELKSLLEEWAKVKEQVVLHNLFQVFDYYKNANISTAKQLGILSFDDLTYFTYRLLHDSISREFFYFKIDSRFQHILLDEFQDTSTLQFLLLKPLIDELFSGVGQSEFKSFFYVGDTKQSLYRFRGGVEELFNSVANQYGIEVAEMYTNYRSSKAVVEQVNRWFKPNMFGFPEANCRDGASAGFVEVRESEELVDEAIVSLESLLEIGIPLSEIAFLVSTNRDGATIQEACYSKGHATRLKTSSSLKHIPRVASIVAMVEYLFMGLELDAKALLQKVGKSLDDIDSSWFHPFMEPVAVVHRLIGDFGYFEEDLNLLKLLEFASEFSNIDSFIEEFRLSSIEVASSSKEGAMIMTIHGSKGLEFEHVILLDRLKGDAPDRSLLLYDYDESLHVKEVYYKMSKRENFDESYRVMLEKQKKLSAKDKMNILYVALTRAIESMIIIKKPKGSIFNPLGITPMNIGKLKTPVGSVTPNKPTQTTKPLITHYGTQELNKPAEEDKKDYKAILFGTALHYTLEMMSSFSIMGLAEAISATKNRYGLELTENQFSNIKNRILSLVTNERFKKLLIDAKISKEQSLSFEGQFKQIDLLLEYEKSCMVLDYKSSKKYHLKHQSQVRYYKKAIFNITEKYTRGMIVYLLEDGVELVEI